MYYLDMSVRNLLHISSSDRVLDVTHACYVMTLSSDSGANPPVGVTTGGIDPFGATATSSKTSPTVVAIP